MPNTEVKLINAESTWPEAAREDRKLLIKKLLRGLAWEFFLVLLMKEGLDGRGAFFVTRKIVVSD